MKPKVSVLTAVYNGELYLKETIESILSQTYINFEHIIIDNNSTDRTPEIIKYYAETDKRIIVIQEKMPGPAYARNAGLNIAKGEWIAILDADDIALPERLELQLNYIEKHPGVCLLGSGCTTIDAIGQVIKDFQYPESHDLLVNQLENRLAFFPHSSDLIQKEAIVSLNGYSTRFPPAEDYDLWLRLSTYGKLACIDKPLIKLRQHPESLSYKDSGQRQQLRAIAAAICHFRRKAGLSDPSQMNEETWQGFLSWVEKELEQAGFFEKLHKYQSLRTGWYNKQNNKIRRIKEFTQQLIHDPLTRKAMWSRYRGNNLALSLAEKSREIWVN